MLVKGGQTVGYVVPWSCHCIFVLLGDGLAMPEIDNNDEGLGPFLQ